jgi:hypothetical protein
MISFAKHIRRARAEWRLRIALSVAFTVYFGVAAWRAWDIEHAKIPGTLAPYRR